MALTAYPTEAQAEASDSLWPFRRIFSHEKDRSCHLPVPITVLSFFPTVVRIP
jgi:hypothetical protein